MRAVRLNGQTIRLVQWSAKDVVGVHDQVVEVDEESVSRITALRMMRLSLFLGRLKT